MYPTHAAVLDVLSTSDEGAEPDSLVDTVRTLVECWMDTEIAGGTGSDTQRHPVPRDGALRHVALRHNRGAQGEIRETGNNEPETWAWEGWVTRPLAPDDTCSLPRTLRTDLQMRFEVRDESAPGRIVVNMRERLAFESGARPPSRQAEMAPPCGLLDALLERFRVFQGNIEWTRSYWTVASQEQVDRLHERIVDPDRTVPLLVCVGDESQGPPVDPAELGRALFGTARVAHIARPRLTGRLRERIGEKHRVGWNVIRLFRAGYTPDDSGGVHRFFRRDEVESRNGFTTWLSSFIRREESFLVSPDLIVRNRLRAAERRQADAARDTVTSVLKRLRAQVGDVDHESLADAIDLLAAELTSAQDRLAEADALAESYATELDQARDELYQLKARVASLDEQVRGRTQAELPSDVMAVPATVLEAIEQATAISGDELVIHDRARKHLERHRLALDPVQVRDTLLTIRDVARQCRAGHGDGRSPADYFRDRGIVLKTDVSDTAKQQYREDYELSLSDGDETRRVLLGPHIDLSIRHRIYWYHDKDADRFIIGHIGDHLRDASTG